MSEQYTEVMCLVCRLAEKMKVKSIKDRAGTWDQELTEGWAFRLNGHGDDVNNIPPYSAMFLKNDMPYAVVNPFGGECIGGKVTEDEICRVLQVAIDAHPIQGQDVP